MTRDTQKQKVYDAEYLVRDILTSMDTTDVRTFDFYGSSLVVPIERKFGDLEGVQRYVNAVLALNWVRDTWEHATLPITVRARKGVRFAQYFPLVSVMAVPPHKRGNSWAMREIIILHETAHHLAPRGEHHGPEFTGIFLRLVTEIIGQEVGLLLTDAYQNSGVKVQYGATV
jgi:putative metallohydrolase (TIGR04338 family)